MDYDEFVVTSYGFSGTGDLKYLSTVHTSARRREFRDVEFLNRA